MTPLHDLQNVDDASTDAQTCLGAAQQALSTVVAADDLFWTSVDLRSRRVQVRREEGVDPELGKQLASHVATHPSLLSYLGDPTDLRARRVSDVSSEQHWRETDCYRNAFRDRRGRYQLSVVVELHPPALGAGWILLREGRDFTDEELVRMEALRPLLGFTHRLIRAQLAGVDRDAVADEPSQQLLMLTPAEHHVLALLGRGLSADRIARLRGCAPATVRKHLEHIYDKFGQHDRLAVVTRARARGLI